MAYINPDKLSKLAGVAFENAIRLHLDSIAMFNNGASYPTALQLSILAQEELGKAFLLEETVFRTWSKEWPEDFQKETVRDALRQHKLKQGWFNRFAVDFTARHRMVISRFTTDVVSGKLEDQKQNATYVGLTNEVVGGKKKVNLSGKITHPWSIKPSDPERQITRVNDLLIVYTEGFIRGVYSTDIYDIATHMTKKLVDELCNQWPKSSYYTQINLRRLRKNPILKNPLSDWLED